MMLSFSEIKIDISSKMPTLYIMQKIHFIGFEMNLYGLSYECPYVIRKGNCPLDCVDSLSFQEKVNWINELSEERERSIWEQHIVCSQSRKDECVSFIKAK